MPNLRDDIDRLEKRLRDLTSHCADVEHENSMLRQKVFDLEAQNAIERADAQRGLRDSTELAVMMENLVLGFNSAMKRFRENQANRGAPESPVRQEFLARVQDDVDKNGAMPPIATPRESGVAKVDESAATKNLRELWRP